MTSYWLACIFLSLCVMNCALFGIRDELRKRSTEPQPGDSNG